MRLCFSTNYSKEINPPQKLKKEIKKQLQKVKTVTFVCVFSNDKPCTIDIDGFVFFITRPYQMNNAAHTADVLSCQILLSYSPGCWNYCNDCLIAFFNGEDLPCNFLWNSYCTCFHIKTYLWSNKSAADFCWMEQLHLYWN